MIYYNHFYSEFIITIIPIYNHIIFKFKHTNFPLNRIKKKKKKISSWSAEIMTGIWIIAIIRCLKKKYYSNVQNEYCTRRHDQTNRCGIHKRTCYHNSSCLGLNRKEKSKYVSIEIMRICTRVISFYIVCWLLSAKGLYVKKKRKKKKRNRRMISPLKRYFFFFFLNATLTTNV